MKIAIIVIIVIGAIIIYPLIYDKGKRHNIRGLKYLHQAKFDKALVAFKKAADLETRSNEKKVMYLRNISLAYHEMEEFESAFYYRKEALKYCESNSYDFHVQKGDIGILKRDLDRAIINFKEALKLNPDKLEANNSIGLIYLGDYGTEYQDLEKALFYNKKANQIYDDNTTRNVLARTYYESGDLQNAERLFRKIIRDTPNHLDSKFSLAVICYYLGKISEACFGVELMASIENATVK